MLGAIKQKMTVQQNGFITVRSPELRAGLSAEVIVIFKENADSPQSDALQNEERETKPTLTELLAQVATEKERMTLTYRNKIFLAVVPIEDVDVVEQLNRCINGHNKSQLELIHLNETLGEFLDIKAPERARLTYQDKVFLAVAPIEDVDVIEELEDCIDNTDADDALKEEGSISWEQVKQELGL
ncbi:MAG: hypothetical protein DRR08_32000 [Candidatus Parabeggiatoa sp. nov. 2]|nr:MAG: hypothetical protein B6247_30460 [Beggiatoa sp. 4572_84]RKZ47990.1 MAG: hypothetical protein DRR08_32000 [Gammaproteobacteria bacterium]